MLKHLDHQLSNCPNIVLTVWQALQQILAAGYSLTQTT